MEPHGAVDSRIPVIIVGAGPAGLTTALLLARRGVRSLVVEKRPGTSPLPRATGINVRTMEIFRELGIADEVAAKSPDSRGLAFMLEMEWLGGPVLEILPYPSAVDPTQPGSPSPAGYQFCSQDTLEPILVGAVERSSYADVAFDTEVGEFDQDAQGVSVRLRNRSNGRVRSITCDYLVGADGAGSLVRRSLGIAMRGHDHLTHDLNIVFEAELAHAVRGRKTLLHRVHHPIFGPGIFRNLDGTGRRWSFFTTWFEDPTLERCADVVRSYARAAEIPVTVTAAGEWERATLLADRFRAGRVFLVGDSAHRVTPHGGLGMNTAIQAAHNLAWKLAAVLQGWGGAGLLDTYEVERREAGGRTVDLSYRLFQSPARQSADVLGHVLGLAYTAGAFVPDGTATPTPPNPVSQYVPAASPGNRAPHLWLKTARGPRSTLDLFGAGLALLTPAQAWVDAARSVAGDGTAPLRAHLVTDPAFVALYEVGDLGAVLVRPDGYVAWRIRRTLPEPHLALGRVLAEVLQSTNRSTGGINNAHRTQAAHRV